MNTCETDMRVFELLDEAVDDAFEAEQLALLKELVDLPSASREVEDVEMALERLDQAARECGLVIQKIDPGAHEVASHRIYLMHAATDNKKTLTLLVGHIDTVFPRSMGFFGTKREGDRLMGPGVLDMKSGLTEMLFALEAIRRVDPKRWAALPVALVVVSDEEIGSPSSRSIWKEWGPRAWQALVFEAGRPGDQIVTRRKGSGLFTIRAHGQAAHAGNRIFDGASAIHAIACAVLGLECMTDPAGNLTVNVGIIRGGSAKNTVPEHAEIEVDVRFSSSEALSHFEEGLYRILRDPCTHIGDQWVNDRVKKVMLRVDGGVARPPMESTEKTQSLRLRYEKHARAVGLGCGEAPLQGGGSDANLLSALGVPCIDGLGPYGEFFHERKEWCSLSSLCKKTKALARFLWAEGAEGMIGFA
ncbi:MAG: M20/M25/M40 family metallo-hydrolase [Sandaracinaceae bacterium]|nr:M20/M25/M40 family metallo-hydrolase [Sandaracinaceae bacterium]